MVKIDYGFVFLEVEKLDDDEVLVDVVLTQI